MKIQCLYDALVNIGELKKHPKNNNKHSEEQITRLAKILEYQGFRYAVKISKLTGYVVSGHARLEAAIKNGWTTVPVVYQDYSDEDQEYADLTADNAIALWSDLDLSMVNDSLKDFDPSFDIELLGIEDFKLDIEEKEPEEKKIVDIFKLEIDCKDYEECSSLFTELESQGYKVKILSI